MQYIEQEEFDANAALLADAPTLLAEVAELRAQRDALVEAASAAQGILGIASVRYEVRSTMGEAAWWDRVDKTLRAAIAAAKD
jgi:hypothetical protein